MAGQLWKGSPQPHPSPPTVPSSDQLAGAVGPAPRPSQVTSQSSQARLAGRPGPGFVFLAARILLVAGTQVLRGSDDCHRAAGWWVRPPASRSYISGRGTGLSPPCVPRPQRPSARAATAARSRRRGRRPLVRRRPLPTPRRVYWSEQRRPRDRRRRRPSHAPALKRATRKRPPPCVPPLGFARCLPAPPGPLQAPSGSGSGAAAAGKCGGRRGPIRGAASSLSRGLPEPGTAVVRDPSGAV